MQFYSLGELIRATFNEFRLVWRRLLIISLPGMAMGVLINYYIEELKRQTPKISPILGPVGIISFARGPDLKIRVVAILLLIGISFLLGYISNLAAIAVFRDRRKQFKFLAAFKEGVRWLVPLILTGLMANLLLGGVFGLLWLPAIIFWVWFSFSRFVIIYEHKWGNNSLLTSRELVRGYGWKITGYRLIIFIIYFALIFPLLSTLGVWMVKNLDSIYRIFLINVMLQGLFWFGLINEALMYERLRSMKPKLSLGKSYKYWLVALTGYLLVACLLFAGFKTGVAIRWFDRVFPPGNNYNYPPPGYTIEEYQQKLKQDNEYWEAVKTGEKQIMDNGLPLYFPTKYNPEIKVDFELVFNKVRAYFNNYGRYPDNLSQLQQRYFGSYQIPINQLTGQPFNYHPRADSNGVNVGFTLCPKIEDPLEYCYRQ